jgi:multiple sugar transport system permease protein
MKKLPIKHILTSTFLSCVVLGFAFISLVPFIWMFSVSMRTAAEALRLPPSIFPESINFTSYIRVFESSINMPVLFRNSLVISIGIVLIQLVTVPMAGYSFARLNYRGRNFLFIYFLVSMMIPQQSIVIPLYIVLRKVNLINNLLSVMVSCFFNAFGVFLFRQTFRGLPRELEDAAYIDGAGYFRTYLQIMLPQTTPSILTLILLTFSHAWNMYFHPLVFLKKPAVMTLSIGLVALRGYMGSGNLSIVMAAVAMAVIPIMVIFFLAQKYFTSALVSSGIKG